MKVDFKVNGDQPLQFVPGSAGWDAQGRFRFDLVGPAGARARVERSADALTWEALGAAGGRDFRTNLAADAEVTAHLPPVEIDAAMDPQRDLRHIDTVFARVFGAT